MFLALREELRKLTLASRLTSYHKAKKSLFYLGLSKNKNELTLLIPYHSNNKKTVYTSKPLVNFNFHNAPLRPYKQVYVNMPQKRGGDVNIFVLRLITNN